MLFKTRFHAGLRDGSIDLTFRRWSRPQVKVGGTYRLAGGPGALVVDAIEKVAVGDIPKREVTRAGFDSIDELKAALRTGGATVTARTPVYRVAFHYERAAPAKPKPATAADVDALVARLERMDRLSRRGPWTKRVLALIAKHPQRRAGDLAPKLDRELPKFKADVRKLKGMGLTKSFEVGYELTALGRKVLKKL
jgi:hypothetical protein